MRSPSPRPCAWCIARRSTDRRFPNAIVAELIRALVSPVAFFYKMSFRVAPHLRYLFASNTSCPGDRPGA